MTIAIVGGGFAGLFCASELLAAGVDDVVVLEGSDRPGGVARSVVSNGYVLEPGAGSFTLPHPHLTPVLAHAGAAIVPAGPTGRRRYVATGSRLVELEAGPAVLAAPLASVAAKVRAAVEPLIPADDGGDPTLDQFLRRRLGDGVGRMAAWLAASGVFAGDPTRLSAAAAFPSLTALVDEHGSIVSGIIARLRSRPHGAGRPAIHVPSTTMADLADGMALRLGTAFRPNCRVHAVRRSGSAWTVDGDERIEASHVVLACRPEQARRLVEGPLREALDGTTSAPVAVVGLGGPAGGVPSPDGYGILAGPDAHTATRGILLESSYAPHRAPPGHTLLKVIAGGLPGAAIVEQDEASIVETVGNEVARLVGADVEVSFTTVVRHPDGIPQYQLGHRRWLAGVDAATPESLHLVGCGYRGVGLAHLAADALRTTTSITA